MPTQLFFCGEKRFIISPIVYYAKFEYQEYSKKIWLYYLEKRLRQSREYVRKALLKFIPQPDAIKATGVSGGLDAISVVP